jgi:hypothetical protein
MLTHLHKITRRRVMNIQCKDCGEWIEHYVGHRCKQEEEGSVPMKIAEELCIWVEACLECKDFNWDGQQAEAAEFAVKQFKDYKEPS